MRTGRAGPRWGRAASGGGRRNSPLKSVNPGWGKGLASPAFSPHFWSPFGPLSGPLRLSGAEPRSRVRRALPSRAAGARPERSGSAYLRALGPAAKAGGKLPQPAGEHRCSRRCGPACVYARVRECVRLCMRPAGWRAGSAKRLLLSPAGDAAVTRSCGRLTGGCWPRRSQNHLDRSARPSASKRAARASGAGGSRSGSRAGAPCSGAERTAPRSPAPAPPPPDSGDAAAAAASLLSSGASRPFAPLAQCRAKPFPNPHPSPSDSFYCDPPSHQGAGRGLPTVTFPHRISGEISWRNEGQLAPTREGQDGKNSGFPF